MSDDEEKGIHRDEKPSAAIAAQSDQDGDSQETLHDGVDHSRKIIFFSSTDPEHPHNWPRKKKALVFAGGILSVINSTVSSALPSGAITFIAQTFNVTSELQLVLPISCYLMGYVVGPVICGPMSENFGRRPLLLYAFILYIIFTMACAVAPNWPALLIFRFLCGVFASAPVAIVGGLYADIFGNPRDRGRAMMYFMAATIVGPVSAPALSGFIAENVSWRWVFGVATLLGVALLPFLIAMPESYLPVLLSKKAAAMRMSTGNPNIIAKTDLQKRSFRYVLTVVMTRPYRMLVQELIVSCISLYCTLAYAIFYMYFEAYPIIFSGPESVYKWSPGLAGLPFIPIGIGAFVCMPIFLWWDSHLAKGQKQHKRWTEIEEYRRLPLACLGGPLLIIALLWIGWSARTNVHWIVPTLSGIPFGMGFILIFMALLNYLTDAYLTYAASAQGIASMCRSIGGAVLPLASKPMFTKLGIAWACSLLAFLSVGVAIIPFAFIRWGEKIRANSRFCLALKEEMRKAKEEEDNERDEEEKIGLEQKDRGDSDEKSEIDLANPVGKGDDVEVQENQSQASKEEEWVEVEIESHPEPEKETNTATNEILKRETISSRRRHENNSEPCIEPEMGLGTTSTGENLCRFHALTTFNPT